MSFVSSIERPLNVQEITWESRGAADAPQSKGASSPDLLTSAASLSPEIPYRPLRPEPLARIVTDCADLPRVCEKCGLARRLIQMAEESYEIMNGDLDTHIAKIRWGQAEMTRLRESLIAHAEATANKTNEVTWWSFMGDVVNALLSAATLIGGAALTSTGIGTGNPVAVGAGIALIGSGAMSLTNLVLSKIGTDPTLTGGLALASAGLALVGGITGWAQVTQEMPRLIMAIVQGGLGIAKGTSMWGQARGEADLAWLQMERTLKKIKETEIQNLQRDATEEIKRASNHALEVFEASKKALQQQETCNLQILRAQGA